MINQRGDEEEEEGVIRELSKYRLKLKVGRFTGDLSKYCLWFIYQIDLLLNIMQQIIWVGQDNLNLQVQLSYHCPKG